MNGKTCARLRHSIIFNGFRWQTEKGPIWFPPFAQRASERDSTQNRIRNVIAVCHALLFAWSECSCGKEPMRYMCVVHQHTCNVQHACVQDSNPYECAACVCVCECLSSDTHGRCTAPMKKRVLCIRTIKETKKNNVANIILWTTTLKKSREMRYVVREMALLLLLLL